jgi:UDP-glucose 4-epimerase
MSLATKRIVVTGAAGFIGSHVCQRLVAADAVVYACTRGPVDHASVSTGIEWRALDVLDAFEIKRAIDEVRPYAVIHLASRVSGSRDVAEVLPMFDANLASTVHLLSAALEVGARVVLAGTMEEPFPGEDLETPPRSPYAASKWAAAAYVRMFGHLWGLQAAVLRPSMVYGPGQSDLTKLVPHTIVSLLRKEPPRLASGRRVSDWIHAQDVADAFLAAVEVASPRVPTVDVGSGELHSVRHVVERITEIVGNGVEPVFGARADPPDEAGRPADLETATATLGWRAAIGLDQGLRETVAWYSAQR